MQIGNRLKSERQRLKLTIPAFGALGDVGKTTVIAWENGTAYPNAAFLEKAAQFGVDVLYVVTGARLDNVATTPDELSYLRICKALPTKEAKAAGRASLIGVLNAYGVTLNPEEGNA